MPQQSENVTLYGERAEEFRKVRAELTDRLGYTPTKAETVGLMMAGFSPETIGAEPKPARTR